MTHDVALVPMENAITGHETAVDQGSVQAARVQFDRAFNESDLTLMQASWRAGEDVAMDNPLDGIRCGWREISAVDERLFSRPARVTVEFHDHSLHEAGDMFYAFGRERGHFERDRETIELAIRTSRIFHRMCGTWKQVHHQGSIDDPALHARYQRAMPGH